VLESLLGLTPESKKKRITPVLYLDTRAFRAIQPEARAAGSIKSVSMILKRWPVIAPAVR